MRDARSGSDGGSRRQPRPRPEAVRRALLLALTAALALLSGRPATAQSIGEEQTYEFLRRQGKLLFEYGKFDEAADALVAACATSEGASDASCHSDLAVAAEKAARIGVAIAAWEAVSRSGGATAGQAGRELHRLRGAYGLASITIPVGRALPSLPMTLSHEGFLIDPGLKAYLAQIVKTLAEQGLPDDELWLPAGSYTLDALTFEVPAGGATAVALGPDVVPWRPQAFGLDDGPPMALGGPTELSVGLVVGLAGIPGGGLGVVPVRPGLGVRLARHLGPVRLEVRGRVTATPTRSLEEDADMERSSGALELLGALDLGVDLQLGQRAFLTPHIALLGGTLGSLLVPCVAEDVATLTVSVGECRLSAVGLGGLAGVDMLIVPGDQPGRVALRVGLAAEFMGAGFVAAPGDLLKGETASLVRSERWRFARLGGVVDVGLALRF